MVRALEVPSLCAIPGHKERFPVRTFLLPRCLDRGNKILEDQNKLSGIERPGIRILVDHCQLKEQPHSEAEGQLPVEQIVIGSPTAEAAIFWQEL